MNISDELQQHLADNPHIDKVYFTADGHHHFNAYPKDGKLYSHIPTETAEVKRDYAIAETLTRAEILGEEVKTIKETNQPEFIGETIHTDLKTIEEVASNLLDGEPAEDNIIEEPAVLVNPSADSPI